MESRETGPFGASRVNSGSLLLGVSALAWYNTGTIWAHEIDIFRSWRLVDQQAFRAVQSAHWRKLPYWVFLPVGLTIAGSLMLLWDHPGAVPVWPLSGNVACQLLSLVLTAVTWGRWQAVLSRDPLGPGSPYLRRILRTHWLRTLLITGGGCFLLVALDAAL
jgi:hypothetical protein